MFREERLLAWEPDPELEGELLEGLHLSSAPTVVESGSREAGRSVGDLDRVAAADARVLEVEVLQIER